MSTSGENNTFFIFTLCSAAGMSWFRRALDPVGTASQRFAPVTANTVIYFPGSGIQNVGLKSQFSDQGLHVQKMMFSIRSATKQALLRILFSFFAHLRVCHPGGGGWSPGIVIL